MTQVVAPRAPNRRPALDERRADVEVLRVLAIAMVVAIHVAARPLIVEAEAGSTGSLYWTTLVLDSAARAGVPVFFAIAGWVHVVAAPVGSWEQLRDRVLRVARPLALWASFYVLWNRVILPQLDGRSASLEGLGPDLLWAVSTGDGTKYHLWYLYTYIPLILVLGAIALLGRGRDDRPGERGGWAGVGGPVGVLILLIGMTVLPSVVDLAGAAAGTDREVLWQLPLHVAVLALLGAVVLGGAGVEVRRSLGWLLFGVAALATVAWAHRYGYSRPFAYDSAVTVLAATGILLACARLRPSDADRWRGLSSLTLGVYLVHPAVLDTVRLVLPATELGTSDVAAVITVVQLPVVLALSFALAALWRRSPTLGRWLG